MFFRRLPVAIGALAMLVGLLCATPASAEIVIFSSGRTLSVGGRRRECGSMVLRLDGGGDITCERAHVAEIRPDEMPDSAPSSAAAAAPAGPTQYAAIIEQVGGRQKIDARLIRAVIA